MKFALLIADMLGMGRTPSARSRLLFFSVWPKDRRIRHWIPGIEKVVVVRRQTRGARQYYDLRFFHKNGWKENYCVAEETLNQIRMTCLLIEESSRLAPNDVKAAK